MAGMASFFGLSFLVRPWRFARLVRAVVKNESNTALEMRLGALLRRRRKDLDDGMPAAAQG